VEHLNKSNFHFTIKIIVENYDTQIVLNNKQKINILLAREILQRYNLSK